MGKHARPKSQDSDRLINLRKQLQGLIIAKKLQGLIMAGGCSGQFGHEWVSDGKGGGYCRQCGARL